MKTLLTLLLSFYSASVPAQQVGNGSQMKQLFGTWQEGSEAVSSGLRKNFRFYVNGKFELNYSEYDEVGRIRGVGGHYRLKDSLLFLTIEYRKELIGGRLERGSPGFQMQEFVLEGAKEAIIRQKDKESSEPCIIVFSPPENDRVMRIQIDNNTYYRLSSDPTKTE